MFGLFRKLFGGCDGPIDSTQIAACDAIAVAVSQLISSPELRQQTKMTGILAIPYARQYVAGALLNVLCYHASQQRISQAKLKTDGLLAVLCRRMGKDCRKGFEQVEDMGKTMRASGAPLPDGSPMASQSIVAEWTISAGVFLRRLPESEFDIFRRVFFDVVRGLCSKFQDDMPESSQTPESDLGGSGPHAGMRTDSINEAKGASDKPRNVGDVPGKSIQLGTDEVLSYSKYLIEVAEDLCQKTFRCSRMGMDSVPEGTDVTIVLSVYLYVLTRMLSQRHPRFWNRSGKSGIKQILSIIAIKYPSIEEEYKAVLNNNPSETEQELGSWADEAYADKPIEVRDRVRYIHCGSLWWNFRLFKESSVDDLDEERGAYIRSAYSVYDQFLDKFYLEEGA